MCGARYVSKPRQMKTRLRHVLLSGSGVVQTCALGDSGASTLRDIRLHSVAQRPPLRIWVCHASSLQTQTLCRDPYQRPMPERPIRKNTYEDLTIAMKR
jgi:hypothetical protein